MRDVKNITVAVPIELYRQTRMLAAEYDTTVTAMVAFLLRKLPDALKRAQFPVGGPKWAPATGPESFSPKAAVPPLATHNPTRGLTPPPTPCEPVKL